MGAARPPIEDPALMERLALSDEDFRRRVPEIYASLPPLEFDAGSLTRALEYPWARPRGSFLIGEDGEVAPPAQLGDEAGTDAISRLAADRDRRPLLAIGSNGSPATLRAKFGHFDEGADRAVLALGGCLPGFDVGAAPQPAIYGSLPATLFPCGGAAVRAALLWVTPAQLTQLAWSEVNYRLGRLRARFELDDEVVEPLEEVYAFVSRFGTFAPGGEPAALAAVPAGGRSAPALPQRQLLDLAATLVLGAGADAAALVRAVHEDRSGTLRLVGERLWPHGAPFRSDRWKPLASTQ
jgi:hypothetical protein